jgi:hypothetical protein
MTEHETPPPETGAGLIDTAKDTLRRVTSSTTRKVRDGVDAVTFKTFRDEVDRAMQDMLDVLSAHEADIAALRRRITELEDAARDR